MESYRDILGYEIPKYLDVKDRTRLRCINKYLYNRIRPATTEEIEKFYLFKMLKYSDLFVTCNTSDKWCRYNTKIDIICTMYENMEILNENWVADILLELNELDLVVCYLYSSICGLINANIEFIDPRLIRYYLERNKLLPKEYNRLRERTLFQNLPDELLHQKLINEIRSSEDPVDIKIYLLDSLTSYE